MVCATGMSSIPPYWLPSPVLAAYLVKDRQVCTERADAIDECPQSGERPVHDMIGRMFRFFGLSNSEVCFGRQALKIARIQVFRWPPSVR